MTMNEPEQYEENSERDHSQEHQNNSSTFNQLKYMSQTAMGFTSPKKEYENNHKEIKRTSTKMSKKNIFKPRETFFSNLRAVVDPIYNPKHEILFQRPDSLCINFNKLTRRSDHNFLGIPKQKKITVIPQILTMLRTSNISQKY